MATFLDRHTCYVDVDRTAEADFEAFVVRSGSSLLRTALMLTGDFGHAQDVVQTALERTARRWTRLHGEPEAYARRVVVNAATDRHRRLRARVEELPGARTEPSDVPDVYDALGLRDALLLGLRALPARQRSVLVLRYFLDLDERATARTLGISVGTVKSSASRGLATLRSVALDLDLLDDHEG